MMPLQQLGYFYVNLIIEWYVALPRHKSRCGAQDQYLDQSDAKFAVIGALVHVCRTRRFWQHEG